MKRLPTTGTGALLELLSPYIPDDLINSLWVHRSGPGRPALFSPAQLFRVMLLTLLTPAHSINLLTELLPEHRPWRLFARLRNRRALPDVRMLHEFRARLSLTLLRRVNEHLLQPLLAGTSGFAKTVALIDSTDLPAATNAYKKSDRTLQRPRGDGGRSQPQRRAESLVHRLQETHAAAVVAASSFQHRSGPVDFVGRTGQSG